MDTYSTLKTAIAGWLNREDLTSRIPDFIELFEARANRELRTLAMLSIDTQTIAANPYTPPTDWLETVSFSRTSGSPPARLRFLSTEQYIAERALEPTGDTTHYTQMNGAFYLLPAPAESIDLELIYRAKIAALSDSAATNWLLTKSPDLYLYGSLVAAEPYLKNDARLPVWQAFADKIFEDMRLEAERAAYPQGALVAKRRTFG